MDVKKYLVIMLAATSLVACSKDEMADEDSGEAAYVSITLDLPAGAVTKAADVSGEDDNALADEIKIKTVDVYAYKFGVVNTKSFATSDLTVDESNKNKWKLPAMKTALGENDIYVVFNKPSGLTLTKAIFEGEAISKSIADLTGTTDGFAMFNTKKVTVDVKSTDKDSPTAAAVSVQRAAAKVVLKAGDSFVDNPGDGNTVTESSKSGSFTYSTLKWVIGNSNKKIFALPKMDDKIQKDPNWETLENDGKGNAPDLTDEYEKAKWTGSITDDLAKTVLAKDGTAAAANVAYCNENTNETAQFGNTTYVLLKGQFKPTTWYTDASGTTANPGTAGTFYVKEGAYYSQAGYQAIQDGSDNDAKKGFTGPYTDGYCYYRINIKESDDGAYQVLRNNYYTITLNSVKAPGYPKDPTDDTTTNPPITPVEQDGYVQVEVTMTPWTQKSFSVDLQ